MTMKIDVAATRLSRELPTAETSIDTAIINTAAILQTAVTARRDNGLSAAEGQVGIAQLVKALIGLQEASNGILRAHKDFVKVGGENGVLPMHDCPEKRLGFTGKVATKVAA